MQTRRWLLANASMAAGCLGPAGPRQNCAVLERCIASAGSGVIDLTGASADIAGPWHRLDGHAVSAPLPAMPLPASEGLLRILVREIENIPGSPFAEDDGLFAAEMRQRTVFVDVIGIRCRQHIGWQFGMALCETISTVVGRVGRFCRSRERRDDDGGYTKRPKPYRRSGSVYAD